MHLEIENIPLFGDLLNFFSGVPIFFTLSGFLIWQSIGRSNAFIDYCKKRFWRIYPELWVSVIIEITVLLLLYHQPIKWIELGLFAFTESTFFQFWTPDCLRGYASGCPNGALWTIGVLIQFYLVAYPTYKFLHGKKNWLWILTIVFFIAIGLMITPIRSILPEILGKLLGQTLLPYFWMFLIASYAAEKKDEVIPFCKKWWWILLAIALIRFFVIPIDIKMSLYYLIRTITLFFAILGVGYAFPKLNVKTDISYGIYIYHMIVINALMTFGLYHKPYWFALTLCITCLIAWFSTKTIGAWAGKMKAINHNG